MLFIDSDVEFGPEAGLRMLVADKEIICTPYRVKNEKVDKSIYTVNFPNPKSISLLPGGVVEIEAGPTGLMLIDRKVFEKIIKNRPDLKIKNSANQALKEPEKSQSLYYNFSFRDVWTNPLPPASLETFSWSAKKSERFALILRTLFHV